MRRRVTQTVVVLGLLVAVALAARMVAGALTDGARAATDAVDTHDAVISSRAGDLADDEADDEPDPDDDEPQPGAASGDETPQQSTPVPTAEPVAAANQEDDATDTDDIDTPTPSPLSPETPETPDAPDTADTPLSDLDDDTDDIDTPADKDGIDTPTPSPATPDTPETPDTDLEDDTDLTDDSEVSDNDTSTNGAGGTGAEDNLATQQLARNPATAARKTHPRQTPLERRSPPREGSSSQRGKPFGQRSLLGATEFPDDPALPHLGRLFDPEWVWDLSGDSLDSGAANGPNAPVGPSGASVEPPGAPPQRLSIRQFSHSPGRSAVANYEAHWPGEAYRPSLFFTVTMRRERRPVVTRFPHDRALPGLAPAVDPNTALRLLDQHVARMPRRRMAVETVRYRPGSRAVLRHQSGKFSFYARIVRPAAVPNLLAAADLIAASSFTSAPVASCWAEGGVVWVPEVPGVNLRDSLRSGNTPDPALLLDGLHSLWTLPAPRSAAAQAPAARSAAAPQPFDLAAHYRRAERTFAHALRDDTEGRRLLRDTTAALNGFVDAWQPTALAHNDFYDDQMILMPDGRVALVDFEEAGPGDPMLDVGNFMAHLSWASAKQARTATQGHAPTQTQTCPPMHTPARSQAQAQARAHLASRADHLGNFRAQFHDAALERFGWDAHDLALREAACLFRICTNAVRRPKPDWQQQIRNGLELTLATLANAKSAGPSGGQPRP